MTANQILGNANYPAISYSGFRGNDRNTEPTIAQIKEDLGLIAGQGYKVIRTYDLQHDFAENVLQAISELKAADSNFEMYVFLGVWIECHGAWQQPNHDYINAEKASDEINEAIRLAGEYSDIIKVISVGNEAMVHWAYWYWVKPSEITKWVKHLKGCRTNGIISEDILITSDENYRAWGGDETYHSQDLVDLIDAVDFLSVHTYPYFSNEDLAGGDDIISGSVNVAANQVQRVKDYLTSIGSDKPVHIGETGWATRSSDGYAEVANVANQSAYYSAIKAWGVENNMTVCLFSAFDETWKIHWDVNHSENNFGIFGLDRTLKS